MSTIKILISHHELRCFIKTDILTPIQTGCALASELIPGMLRDDQGENISALNPKYCEFTALYWAWKNYAQLGCPDYIGLMHNRRYMLFNESLPVPDKGITWLTPNIYCFPPNIAALMPFLQDEDIHKAAEEQDVLILNPYYFEPSAYDTVYPGPIMLTRFLNTDSMTEDLFSVFTNTVRQYAPDYVPELEEFLAGNKSYVCNIFVMKRQIFEEYCSFLFPLMEEMDKQVDSSGFSAKKLRWLGYLGEYLTTLFIFKLQKRQGIKLREMDGAFVMNKRDRNLKRLWRYWLLKNICFGKARRKYQANYNEILRKINIFDMYLQKGK